MKKILLFTFVILSAGLSTGCTSDCAGNWSFVVKNETDREIIVNHPYSTEAISIAAGESQIVYDAFGFVSCDSKKPLENQPLDFYLPYGSYNEFVMAFVDGEEIPGEIWQNKYWHFISDHSTATYTLTVTDELLASLSPEEEPAR